MGDLTAKSKSIALSRFLGPDGAAGVPSFLSEVEDRLGPEGRELARRGMEIIISAAHPDDAIKRFKVEPEAARFVV